MAAVPAHADTKLTDLRKVDLSAFAEPRWQARKQRSRLILSCGQCQSLVAADIQLSRAPNGMEQRIRSGQTTAKTMLDICKSNAAGSGAACYGVQPVKIGKAVGFASDVRVFDGVYAATYTIYQDGRMLLIRNTGPSRKAAQSLGRQTLRAIAAQVVR